MDLWMSEEHRQMLSTQRGWQNDRGQNDRGQNDGRKLHHGDAQIAEKKVA